MVQLHSGKFYHGILKLVNHGKLHGILWFTTRFTMVYYGKLKLVNYGLP